MLKVTADIFSGRPNPEWIVQEAEAASILRDLSKSGGAAAALDSGFQGLGSRGLIVESLDDRLKADFGVPSRFRIGGGGGTQEGHAVEIAEKLVAAMKFDAGAHPALADAAPGALPLDSTLQKLILDSLPGRLSGGAAATHEPLAHEDATLGPAEILLQCAYEASAFNPGFWNDPAHIGKNNCYNYASNRRTDTFAQPGRATGHMYSAINCGAVTNGAVSDGASLGCAPANEAPRWWMALVIAPGPGFIDYHWYRKSHEGFWGHKPGGTAARNIDNSGHIITDPRTANRGPYTIFCRFMYAQRKMVVR